MVERELPFSASTAQRLMAIADHPVLSKAAHVQLLPPSWGTLYELTKLPPPVLEAKIEDGTITPKIERGPRPDMAVHRRHLTVSQRSMIAAEFARLENGSNQFSEVGVEISTPSITADDRVLGGDDNGGQCRPAPSATPILHEGIAIMATPFGRGGARFAEWSGTGRRPVVDRDSPTLKAETEARLWEIAENLHRAELTKLERAEQIEEWRALKAAQVLKSATPSAGGNQPAEAGVRKTAEELGIEPSEVSRASKVASIAPEAKEAAREAGLDDNQSALLRVAAQPQAEPECVPLEAHFLFRRLGKHLCADLRVAAAPQEQQFAFIRSRPRRRAAGEP